MTAKVVKDQAEKSLNVEILEAILKPVQRLKESWKKTPELEQRAFLNQLNFDVSQAVKRAVNIIAADKRPTMEAAVDSVTFKDGIKATLKLSKAMADRHELADAQGQMVLIVITNTEKFTGGDAPKPDPDQPELPGVKDDDKGKPKRDARSKRGTKPEDKKK